MLVKIIAVGFTQAIWKNVFHHLRSDLPNYPFAAGIFSATEEITYLAEEFFPQLWQQERPDFFICEPPFDKSFSQRLDLFKNIQVEAKKQGRQVDLLLALASLEQGLQQMTQGPLPLVVELDNKNRYALADPALVIEHFPDDFPRLNVSDHAETLMLALPGGQVRSVTPGALKTGTMMGFSEITSIHAQGGAFAPDAWLRRLLKAEKIRLPRGSCAGLIKEGKGLYLFPGIPLGRIVAIHLGDVRFSGLLELGRLNQESPGYTVFLKRIRAMARQHQKNWKLHTQACRLAETKSDFPIVFAGGPPLMRNTLAALFQERGFQRCSTLNVPADDLFREPSLLVQMGAWEKKDWGSQVEQPQNLDLTLELNELMTPLNTLMDWQELEYKSLEGELGPITERALADWLDITAQRDKKARQGKDIASKRLMLLEQEVAVLTESENRLKEVLEAEESHLAWVENAPLQAKQVLLFSHDQEEAGAVLQSLTHIAKKRWFDLTPYNNAESLRNLDMETVRHYRQGGLTLITASSREKLNHLSMGVAEQLRAATRELEEAHEAEGFYQQEGHRLVSNKADLARHWVRDRLEEWLDDAMGDIMKHLAVLRARHERSWFSRGLVSRIALVASSPDNRAALLSAANQLYPALNLKNSQVIPLAYVPANALADGEKSALEAQAKVENLNPEALRIRLEKALQAKNQALLNEYLQMLNQELMWSRADLLLIEYQQDVAFAVLEFLRENLPNLQKIPAILVLPEAWSPKRSEPMPWPRTRVVLMERMGALTSEDCEARLRELYSA